MKTTIGTVEAAVGVALGLLVATPAPLGARAAAQDKPTPITGKLPARAACVVCTAGGEGHGEERAAAGVMYKGKAYYFCNKGEVATFVKDPNAYLPAVVPRPAPPAALKTLEGAPTSLAAMKGKVVLVDFWVM
jgi:YHS domain-containing protein